MTSTKSSSEEFSVSTLSMKSPSPFVTTQAYRYITSGIPQYKHHSLNDHLCQQPSLLRHPGTQLTMKAIISGVAPLMLSTLCWLVTGRPLAGSKCNLTCQKTSFRQIQCQVAELNATAQGLFDSYVRHQGSPFSKDRLDALCNCTEKFPSFVNETSDTKEKLIALYKIFAFFNASLGNITKDTENHPGNKEDLLKRLRDTTATSQGLLSNLRCLLCTQYNVSHVNVTYDTVKKGDFEKKKQGCTVLRKYTTVISRAALAMGRCQQQT
uniref:Leukemia inhibitory factor n=1 Tax=Salvator merianae TaxID=96440 RepID=A0A8D0KHJ8_SALMN